MGARMSRTLAKSGLPSTAMLCTPRPVQQACETQLFFFTFGSPSPPKTQSGLPACTPIAHLLPDPSCILLVARGAQQLTARQPFRTYIGEPSQTFGAKARPTHPQASKQRPRTRAPSDQHNPSRMEALLETRPFQIYFVTLSGYTGFAQDLPNQSFLSRRLFTRMMTFTGDMSSLLGGPSPKGQQ